MNNEVKKYYLKEFSYYDGEFFIAFNIVSIDFKEGPSMLPLQIVEK